MDFRSVSTSFQTHYLNWQYFEARTSSFQKSILLYDSLSESQGKVNLNLLLINCLIKYFTSEQKSENFINSTYLYSWFIFVIWKINLYAYCLTWKSKAEAHNPGWRFKALFFFIFPRCALGVLQFYSSAEVWIHLSLC